MRVACSRTIAGICKIAEGRPHDVLADPGVVKAYLGRSHHA
jgi:ABC-type branched-subunit amino acid transport system ATPase component